VYKCVFAGEYYTNELKSGEGGRDELSEEDLPTTEEELLGEKKRTEHFLWLIKNDQKYPKRAERSRSGSTSDILVF